jgi:hypothetical protein
LFIKKNFIHAWWESTTWISWKEFAQTGPEKVCDKVYQLLAHAYGWWFSPDTPASSTTKTGRHDIAEILLKVALKHGTDR